MRPFALSDFDEYPQRDVFEPESVRGTLARADLARAYITGSFWRHVPALGVGLHRADLRGASFGYAEMTRANVSCAQVAAADFRHANLRQTSLEGTRSLHEERWGSTV